MRDRTLPNPIHVAVMLALALALAVSAVLAPIPVRAAVATGQKVVVIVGPVGGGSIQTNYLNRGESIADTAEALGATVVRVFSPNATYANARAAVNGANVIVYIGHGSGYPNPYSGTLQTAWNNGWGLNLVAGVDANDPTGHGHTIGVSMVYCGEAALEGKAKPSSVPSNQWCWGGKITPAPNFAMVYSNACYTPGAGETEEVAVSSEATALTRVGGYSRPMLAMGGTYFATDLGSRDLVETILENPNAGWGQIYTMASGYVPGAVKTFAHPSVAGRQAWLQKSPGPGGATSYFYAFAGDPSRTPNGGTGAPVPDLARPKITAQAPFAFATGVATNTNVTVTFDKDVVGIDEWGMTLHPIDAPWQDISASVAWDDATNTATLNPDASLNGGSWYVAELNDNVQDQWGNPLGETEWAFRTTGGGADPLSEQYPPQTPLWFAAGSYTGRKFDAYGNLLASKTTYLASTSSAPTSQQSPIPGQSGTWFLITAGAWAGYWMQDNAGTTLGTPPPPPPTPIATYNPPQPVYFNPGTYVGRKFDAYGNVTATKSYTLATSSSAPTSTYSTLTGQSGNWYLITAGVWSGYWMQEAAGVSMTPPPPPPPPPTPIATYNPPQSVYFSPGTYVGRKFDAYGNVTATKSYTLATTSAAPTSTYSAQTGQSGNWFLITAGVWSGYWVQEGPGVVIGTPPPPPPTPIATYNPAAPLYFVAGTYVGRKFDAYGNVTATKSYTLATNSSAPTSTYSAITAQSGSWYLITAGVWAGYWIQESAGTSL